MEKQVQHHASTLRTNEDAVLSSIFFRVTNRCISNQFSYAVAQAVMNNRPGRKCLKKPASVWLKSFVLGKQRVKMN
jgi:hypothetical protein